MSVILICTNFRVICSRTECLVYLGNVKDGGSAVLLLTFQSDFMCLIVWGYLGMGRGLDFESKYHYHFFGQAFGFQSLNLTKYLAP